MTGPLGSARLLVSACLLGSACRYDGRSLGLEDRLPVVLREKFCIVPVCPEQLGGLSTPRSPSEITVGDGNSVLQGFSKLADDSGKDVTQQFLRGSAQAVLLADQCRCSVAILKERSPSCGVHTIVRGGKIVRGTGVTAAALKNERITVYSNEDDLLALLLDDRESTNSGEG